MVSVRSEGVLFTSRREGYSKLSVLLETSGKLGYKSSTRCLWEDQLVRKRNGD